MGQTAASLREDMTPIIHLKEGTTDSESTPRQIEVTVSWHVFQTIFAYRDAT